MRAAAVAGSSCLIRTEIPRERNGPGGVATSALANERLRTTVGLSSSPDAPKPSGKTRRSPAPGTATRGPLEMPRAVSSRRTRRAATCSYRPPWPASSPAGAPRADAAGHSAHKVEIMLKRRQRRQIDHRPQARPRRLSIVRPRIAPLSSATDSIRRASPAAGHGGICRSCRPRRSARRPSSIHTGHRHEVGRFG